MTTLTVSIIVVFVVGYLFIALESITKVNKAAIALLMFVACWTLFMVDPTAHKCGKQRHRTPFGKYLNNALLPHGCYDNRRNSRPKRRL